MARPAACFPTNKDRFIKYVYVMHAGTNIIQPFYYWRDQITNIFLCTVQYILLSKYYLEERKWCNDNYMPSFKDQIELSTMSSTAPLLTVSALMAVGNKATKEARMGL